MSYKRGSTVAPLPNPDLSLGVARFSCLDGGEAYNERVITVGIGWVLLASATSGFSGYIKLAYCSSAKGAPVAQLVRASD